MATDQNSFKFSVIIPCRNAGAWIADTLASVASQTLQPFEIIVVDDGSTDDSVEQIRNFSDRVIVLHSSHRNGAGTRNVGIEAATGDWIAFLDADDIWYPDHLERAANLLDDSNDVGFLNWFDQFRNESPEHRISRSNQIDIDRPTSGLSDVQFYENYARTFWFNMHGCVVKRSRLLEVGMLDSTQIRRHDIEMWMRVLHGQSWSYDPIPSSAYRVDTPNSISRNIASAAYYWHVAIKKNVSRIPIKFSETLLQRSAEATMSTAFKFGSAADIDLAFREAFSALPVSRKLIFSIGKHFPKAFRTLLQFRQRPS